MTFVIFLVAGALVGGFFLVKMVQRKQRENRGKPSVVIIREDPTTIPATTRSVQPTTGGIVVRAAPRAVAPTEMTEPEPDPRREEESWKAVEQARFKEPVVAIVNFIDYLEQHPNSPFRKDVDSYVEEALDRLWWARIKELFAQTDQAKAEIARRQEEIKLSKEEQFKAGLQDEIKKWSEVRERAEEELRKQMKFTAADPPNLYDSAQLAVFRSQRSNEYYQKWKRDVLDSIRRTRGQRLPWKR